MTEPVRAPDSTAGRARRGRLASALTVLALLALSLLASLGSGAQRLQTGLEDALAHWAAPPLRLDEVLVVDIDDAALRALQPQLGDWPYRRDVYALLLDYLREAGVRLVAFDIVFGDARAGDTAFAQALALRPDVVLAAAALQQPLESDRSEAALLQRVSLPAASDAPALDWTALTLPQAGLLGSTAAPAAIGIITTRLDGDGRLRRLPLLHRVQQRLLPALPLATQLRLQGLSQWQLGDSGRLKAGTLELPLDAQAGLRLALPDSEAELPRLGWQALMQAALGSTDGAALQARLRGRTVFVGSSAFFADAVMTPQGQMSGTALMAATHAALGQGLFWQAPSLPWLLGAWLIALAPLAWSAWRGTPRLGPHALAVLLAAATLAALAWAALQQRQLLAPLGPLLLLALGLAYTALAQLRWELRSNRQLRYEREVADAANQAKSQFLANVSHEIRTPMTALLGTAELLARTELTAVQRRYVALFQSSGQSLFDLINELLDISKIEAGRLELDPQDFELRALAEQCLALLRARAEAQGLWLQLELAPDAQGWVHGDAKRLSQVLLNLLGNAIKFTRSGGVTLMLRRQGEALLITVRDTGIGIAPSKHELIFQPFSQADGSTTRYFGGTGLGLAISRSLVHLMGGRIWLESEPGRGSSFHLELPLPPLPPSDRPASPANAETETTALPPQRLLLCEDNEVNVIVLQAMLTPHGHEVDVAGHGARGVEMFRQHRYDLVLMDVQMPGMDGHSATRAMRLIEAEQGWPRTPIVALTANAFADDARRSLAAGCDDHLTKPIAEADLLAALQRWGRHGPAPAPRDAAPAEPAPPLPPAELQLIDHARAFLAAWQQSWSLADADQALRMLDDLQAVAARLGNAELGTAAGALQLLMQADADEASRAAAQAALDAARARALLALG